MTWAGIVGDPIRSGDPTPRQTRPIYLPPHLKKPAPAPTPNPHPPTYSDSTRPRAGCRSRGRRSPRVDQNPHYSVASKLDDLGPVDANDVAGSAINFEAYEDVPVEASGSDVPAPANSFAEIDLGEGLGKNIRRCQYVKPTPIQRHAIPIAVAGRDLMACAQTGSGKTAAFCFPIISGILRNRGLKIARSGRGGTRMAYPCALILSPTRELSCQIYEEAKKFAYNTGVKIVVVYGGAPIVHQFRNLEKGVDILVATPGRLVDMIGRARVSLKMIRYLALDEADRMLDMGFEPQIRKIVQQMDMPPPGQRQTLLFSATFPHEIQRLASDFLSDYIFLTVGRVGSSTGLIAQKVELVQDMDKRDHLVKLLRSQKRALTLVFVETKRGADSLEHWLSMNGFPATAIHGDKVQMERERALKSFKSGTTPILVATDVAARGLDIPHVSHVINFDLPKGIDDYVHRIGRTGRAGKTGVATALFSDKNMPLAKSLVELMKEANQEVPLWLSEYAEGSYGSNDRGWHYGGSKFGGYDIRSDAPSGSYNYDYSSNYHFSDSAVDSYSSPATAYDYLVPEITDYNASSGVGQAVPGGDDYYSASNDDIYTAGSRGFGSQYDSIVATGWD